MVLLLLFKFSHIVHRANFKQHFFSLFFICLFEKFKYYCVCFFIFLIPCYCLFGEILYLPKQKQTCIRISFLLAHTQTLTLTILTNSLSALYFTVSNNMGLNDFKSYLIGLAVLLFIHNLVTVLAFTTPEKQDFLNGQPHYHSEEQLLDLFAHLAKKYPNLAKVHSLGASVEGRDLNAIQISNNVGHRDLLKPMFKYVANMHGYVKHLNLTNNLQLFNETKTNTHTQKYIHTKNMNIYSVIYSFLCLCVFVGIFYWFQAMTPFIFRKYRYYVSIVCL